MSDPTRSYHAELVCQSLEAARLLQNEQTDALIRHLRLCRCELMEQLHESQKRVDCMDYLIRQTEKTRIAK